MSAINRIPNQLPLRPVAQPAASTRREAGATQLSLVALVSAWTAAAWCVVLVRGARWSLAPVQGDLFTALPAAYWLCLALGALAAVAAIALSQRESVVTGAVAALTFQTGPAFLLGIYPAVSGWDSFLHGSSAVSLLRGAGIPATNAYASQYPGPATLLATVTAVTGLDLLVIEILITILANLALSLIFMGIAQRFVGLRAAAVAAGGVLTLTPTVMTNEHFSQWLVAYVALLALALLLFIVVRPAAQPVDLIGANLAATLLAGAAIVSHPFLPVVATALVTALAIWSWRTRPEASPMVRAFLLTVLVASAAWMVFVATVYFDAGIRFFRFALFQTQDVVDTWVPLPLPEVFRRTDDVGRVLILARTLGYLLVAILAVLGLLRRHCRDVFLILWVSGWCGASVLVGFASEAPWIQRALYIGPPFLVLAAVVGWRDLPLLADRGRWARRPTAVLGSLAAASLVLVGVALWHPPTLLYSVHPGNVAFVIWPQEQAAAQFAAAHRRGDEVLGSDLQSLIVYSYTDPSYPVWDRGVLMASDLQQRLSEHSYMFDGALVLRSERQEIAAYQSQDEGPAVWDQLDERLAAGADRVYDNGFAQLYRVRAGIH